ncbi:MAG: FAD-dependent thymidylate synthase [Candidatus Falkowbacteria bacterium]
MPKIFIIDELPPQDNAMLQALYSRSPESVTKHLEKVQATGSGKFMSEYYIGYGHQSIADCGSTTIFIEGISTLADKLIQDWPLYSGQETSTRYVDMAKQPIIDPLGTPASKAILDAWMEFYMAAQAPLQEHVKRQHPLEDGQNEAVYNKAIKARSFDILRAWLPAGITTQLSWHTNLRQAYDHLAWLMHHPLQEARITAQQILSQLQTKYPESFSQVETAHQIVYRQLAMEKVGYYDPCDAPGFTCDIQINMDRLAEFQEIIDARSPMTNLPVIMGELGTVCFNFMLDFGSFRDIQRHRNGTCRIPLLTDRYDFNPWYLFELPDDLCLQGLALIEKQQQAISLLNASPVNKQYYLPLGYRVPCTINYGLPAMVYTIELRSSKTVHPTLRHVIHQMFSSLHFYLPNLKMYVDLSPNTWDIKRGTHDITQRQQPPQSLL